MERQLILLPTWTLHRQAGRIILGVKSWHVWYCNNTLPKPTAQSCFSLVSHFAFTSAVFTGGIRIFAYIFRFAALAQCHLWGWAQRLECFNECAHSTWISYFANGNAISRLHTANVFLLIELSATKTDAFPALSVGFFADVHTETRRVQLALCSWKQGFCMIDCCKGK